MLLEIMEVLFHIKVQSSQSYQPAYYLTIAKLLFKFDRKRSTQNAMFLVKFEVSDTTISLGKM